ncbi:P2Y purinoceptor 1-like [Engystomops pustulosus]|uniref:P2Y purinoceptor 1-like n=1 Tax=Engystomops pustulosus TaxID=76066 RepID=UPI003AFA8EF4
MEEDFFDSEITQGKFNSSSECKVNKTFSFHYLSSVYLLVFLLGLLGNGFGLWNLCMHWKKWTSLNVFVLNLGVADLLYVGTLPFFVSYYLSEGVWMFGYKFCRLARLLFHINMYASIGFLTCISVQRYLGIVHPMRMMGSFQDLRPSVYISLLVWILVAIQILPNLFYTNAMRNDTYCHDSTINEHLESYTPYTLMITITGFFIPFLIIMTCYIRVLTVLTRNKNVDKCLKSRSIKQVIIILTLFAVCFFPYYIFRNLNLVARVWQLRGTCTQSLKNVYVSYQVTRGLAATNSAINPLLYLVTNENCVSKFQKMQRRIWSTLVYMARNHSLPNINVMAMNVKEEEMSAEL